MTTLIGRGSAPEYDDNGSVRVVGQAANQAGRIVWAKTRFRASDEAPGLLRGYLQPDDVLINSTGTGTLGRVGHFVGDPQNIPCVADGHITVVRACSELVQPRFLFYALSSDSFQSYLFAALIVGATNQIELSREGLAGAYVSLPSLNEQRQISTFLDDELCRIDDLVGAQRAVLKVLIERRRRILEDVLVGDSISGGRSIPLSRLVEHGRPIMYGIVLPGPDVPDGVPIVKGGDVAASRLSLATLKRTTHEIASGYRRSRLRGGDLVISIRGSVGEVASVPAEIEGANLTQDAARISPAAHVNGRWLELVLQSPTVQADIRSRITGATIKGLNIWDLCRIRVPDVDRDEQVLGTERVSVQLAAIEELDNFTTRQIEVLAERRQALITAAVTGKIDMSTATGATV